MTPTTPRGLLLAAVLAAALGAPHTLTADDGPVISESAQMAYSQAQQLRQRAYTDPQVMAQVIDLYRRAGRAGHQRAFGELGYLLLAAPAQVITRIDQPRHLGMEYLSRSIAAGDANAAMFMGYAFEHGYGVQVDREQALARYRQAVDMGSVGAMRRLAEIAEPAQRLGWWLAAAQAGDADAMLAAGKAYLADDGLVPVDREQARHWLTQAQAAGQPEAAQQLAALDRREDALQAQVHTLQSRLDQQQQAATRQVAVLESLIREQGEQLDRATRQVEQTQADLLHAQQRQAQAEAALAQARIKHERAATQAGTEQRRLAGQITLLEQIALSYRLDATEALTRVDEALAQVAQQQEQVTHLERVNRELTSQQDEWHRRRQQLEADRAELARQVEQVQQASRIEREQLVAQVAGLSAELDSQRIEHEQHTRTLLAELERTREELDGQVVRLTADLDAERIEHQQAQQMLAKIRHAQQQLDEQVAQLTQELDAQQREHQAQADRLAADLEQARQQLAQLHHRAPLPVPLPADTGPVHAVAWDQMAQGSVSTPDNSQVLAVDLIADPALIEAADDQMPGMPWSLEAQNRYQAGQQLLADGKEDEAMVWFQAAANQGHEQAQDHIEAYHLRVFQARTTHNGRR